MFGHEPLEFLAKLFLVANIVDNSRVWMIPAWFLVALTFNFWCLKSQFSSNRTVGSEATEK